MDTQNDGLEKVAPFKYGHFGIYLKFIGCMYLFLGGSFRFSILDGFVWLLI